MKYGVTVLLYAEDVENWQRGLYILARSIRRQMEFFRLNEWPNLKQAQQIEPWLWKLVFTWS